MDKLIKLMHRCHYYYTVTNAILPEQLAPKVDQISINGMLKIRGENS